MSKGMVMLMETPVHAPLSVQIRLEIAKLRKMSFKNKMEYIWEYYKPLLAGIVVFLILIGSLINTRLINPPPQSALFIEWSAGFVLHDQLYALAEVLTEYIVDEADNEIVMTTLFIDDLEDPQMLMAMVSRRMAMLSAGELDVFIQNPEQLIETAQEGIIMPLDNILTEFQLRYPGIFSIVEERLLYAWYSPLGDGGEERIMGIDISGSPLLEELGFHESELIFSVVTNSGRIGNVAPALVLLLDGL